MHYSLAPSGEHIIMPAPLPAHRRAVAFETFGSPEVLRVLEVPLHQPQAGEVLVQVQAATVNPTDLLMLGGSQAARMRDLVPPYIAGMEIAGKVVAIGEGVQGLALGQAVIGIVNPRRPQGGAQAQFVCLPAASIAPLPAGSDLIAAATLPMNGLTAWMCLEFMKLPVGASLLVTGAAGAVGGFVVALARRAGLHVVADTKEEDRELLTRLGAHELVPRGDGFATAVRVRYPAGLDGVVDTALLGDAAAGLLRTGGAMVSLRGSQDIHREDIRHTHVSVLQEATNQEALRWLVDRMQDGTLAMRVGRVLPMAQAAEAYGLVSRGGLRGRVVLTP